MTVDPRLHIAVDVHLYANPQTNTDLRFNDPLISGTDSVLLRDHP